MRRAGLERALLFLSLSEFLHLLRDVVLRGGVGRGAQVRVQLHVRIGLPLDFVSDGVVVRPLEVDGVRRDRLLAVVIWFGGHDHLHVRDGQSDVCLEYAHRRGVCRNLALLHTHTHPSTHIPTQALVPPQPTSCIGVA